MTTYLYLKQSPSGLLYLGKTTRDPNNYKGSGTYWNSHLKKHKYKSSDIKTWILHVVNSSEDLTFFGLYYSKLFNIIENKSFANLKYETGDGGSIKGKKFSIEHRKKLSDSLKGKSLSYEHKEKIKKSKLANPTKISKDHREKLLKGIKDSVGWKHTNEAKEKMKLSKANMSKETRELMSKAKKGNVPHNCIKVKSVNENMIFQSISEASRHYGISVKRILTKIKKGELIKYNQGKA